MTVRAVKKRVANIQIKWIEEKDQVLVFEVGQIELLQFIVDNGSALPEWCLFHDCVYIKN